jgi:drug/metabolite transporter (DMT)-like permease
MPGLLPRLSERGRRDMLIAAVVAGLLGVALAVWRRDYSAAVLIAVTLALLAGVYVWSRGGHEDDASPDDHDRSDDEGGPR